MSKYQDDTKTLYLSITIYKDILSLVSALKNSNFTL